MRKLVLGLGALALTASAAFAADQTTDNTRMAAADTSVFSKLDADVDGRVSAIEAANDSKVAAGFTAADADKDGYLSKAEFATLGKSSSSDDAQRGTSNSPRPQSQESEEEATTAPPQQ